MSFLTETRRAVFYDAEGTPYQPVRHGDRATGRSVFKIRPISTGNLGREETQTEDILEVARAVLIDMSAVRCKALGGGDVKYLSYGPDGLMSYEVGPEVAQTLGIPEKGSLGDKIAVLSRRTVEAAMDAYDRFQLSGAHGDIFKAFGEPRDYWVRSTRERANRVYPTKPLIGYILNKTEFSGGWGQKADAAARLHNLGFIIVDRDDVPIPPPIQYEHLVTGADRIRLCALNYFIEPAREQEANSVSIRAGNLAAMLSLKDSLPNICQALGGEKFQQLAKVPPPTYSEPNPSISTVFTYQLSNQEEVRGVTEVSKAMAPRATNLILYGPPGTGKTFQTAWEAVRLCLGDDAASALKGYANREALMLKYRELASEGLIEFVTFHQSMSYEEFVEGLRPITPDDAGDDREETQASTGFRLLSHDGVFKRISERARLDVAGAGVPTRLDRTARIFKVSLGRRQFDDDKIRYALDHNLIDSDWGGDIDWSDERFEDFNEILNNWRSLKDPNATGHDGNVVITYSFRSDMQIGDYVIISDGRDRIQAFGKISGNYAFVPNAEYRPHRRAVEWIWKSEAGVERSRVYPNTFRRHSVYKLNQSLLDWDALETIVYGNEFPLSGRLARDHVLIIDEINRANVSKVFGELITLLEPDKRLGMANEIQLTLPYSKKKFGVPANLHIVGTMNTADRSIALLDTALRRRFSFRELMPDPTVLPSDIEGINLQKLLRTINERVEYLFDREHQIGHAYFTSCQTRSDVEEVMRYKVIPLLAEYFYEDWSKVAAVLGDTRYDRPRFLIREEIKAPDGVESDTFSGSRQRWRVRPERDENGNAGFDFTEFKA